MIVARSFFSLLEMMVVIAIIGFLAGTLVINYSATQDDAAVEATKSTINQVSTALKLYKIKHKNFPSTDEGLQALVESKQLNSYPEDAWGERLNYQYPSSRDLSFDIWSTGADRADGGDGPNTDIFNEK